MKNSRSRMKMTVPILLLLLQTLFIAAQTITQNFPKETLISRLEKIATQSKQAIVYDPVALTGISVPPLVSKKLTPELIIQKSLVNTGWTYKITSDKAIVIIKIVSPPSLRSSAPGRLFGLVTDDKGEPIIGASVVIPGTGKGTVTDVNGNYTLQDPSGENTIEVSFISYQKKKITGVDIQSGKTTKLDITLSEDNKQLSEVVVTAQVQRASAAGMLLQQKSTISMTDGISADLIKKTSDNNVAQVLKRVAGVTINEGKFVTVRGMSERYNNVQLNGSSLPSTEPNRRNFSFDIIPSALVSNVTIAKTFMPDMPGEFTGGLVEIQTLSVPEERFLTVTLGSGLNTNATGKEFLSTKRFAADYFLGGTEERQWYTGLSQEDLTVNTANAASWNRYPLYKFTAQPMQSYSIAGGGSFKLGKQHKIGVVGALTYRNEQTKEELKEMITFTKDSLLKQGERYTMTTSVGAIANIGWETKGHAITWRNLFNNRFSHSNQKRYIWKTYEGYPFMDIYSVVLNSRVMQSQLDGKHHFLHNKLLFSWNASINDMERTNPGDAYSSATVGKISDAVSYFEGGRADWIRSVGSSTVGINNGHLMYSNLHELKKNLSADVEIPFTILNNPQRVKAGYWGVLRTAKYRQQYLKLNKSTSSTLNGADINDFFDPKNFEGDSPLLSYARGGAEGGADHYDGRLGITAGYLMGDFSVFRKWHITGGFRMEKGNNRVITSWGRYVTSLNKYIVVEDTATLDKTDWLPALSLVYNLTDKINVRFAYSKTLIRPDFRELSYCAYYNVNDRLWVYNLKPLKQTDVKNYDLRLEFYPGAGEVISLSAFYKKFTNPVEMIAQLQASAQEIYLYSMNLKDAELKGLEFNLRKSLGFIAPRTFLNDIYLNGNFTVLKGNITYNYDAMMNPIEGIGGRERPLQGLSPYVVNAGITYQGSCIGMSVNYGRNGRKLVIGGDYAKLDQYENPRNVLDVQLSALFLKKRLEVKLNASDILNEDVIIYRNCGYTNSEEVIEGDPGYINRTGLGMDYNPGDWVMSRINKGINFSASVSYKF